MSDWRNDYWREAASCALDEMGKLNDFTPAELGELGKALAVSAECQSMASAPVENPLASQNEELKRQIAKERDAHEDEVDIWRHGVASFSGAAPRDVVKDGNRIRVWRGQ